MVPLQVSLIRISARVEPENLQAIQIILMDTDVYKPLL